LFILRLFDKANHGLFFPDFIHASIVGDRVQPSFEAPFWVEAFQAEIGSQERILGDIFGFVFIAQNIPCEVKQLGLILVHYHSKCFSISPQTTGDNAFFVHIWFLLWYVLETYKRLKIQGSDQNWFFQSDGPFNPILNNLVLPHQYKPSVASIGGGVLIYQSKEK
jgi:hypothetical protein